MISGSLFFSEVRVEDEGEYQCLVENTWLVAYIVSWCGGEIYSYSPVFSMRSWIHTGTR